MIILPDINRTIRQLPDSKTITGQQDNYRTARQLPDSKTITGQQDNYRTVRQLPDNNQDGTKPVPEQLVQWIFVSQIKKIFFRTDITSPIFTREIGGGRCGFSTAWLIREM
jgi:hypothetical protein